jgi:carbon-monoxide dehydrogenase large subunit
MSALGRSERRPGDPVFLRGEARFVADLKVPAMLEAVVVRSPHACADIRALDLTRARRAPGVVGAWAADDLPAPVPRIPMRLTPADELTQALQPVLAQDRVRYSGEPVALVVAVSRYRAEDAAELVEVDYAPRPAVTDTWAAQESAAPRLHDGFRSNEIFRLGYDRGTPNGEGATLALEFRIQRHTGMPLETRGLLAVPGDRLTVYGVTKVVHWNHGLMARLLGVEASRLHLVETAVGGGFGIRGEFYPEDYLVPWAALSLGRPVRWIEDRLEHMRAANHSREQRHQLTLGTTPHGELYSLEDHILVDTGAYVRTHGVTVPELTQAMLPGPYRWGSLHVETGVVVSNKTPAGTYRGPGRFEGTFARERAIDALARERGWDPVELRRESLIRPADMPYANGGRGLGEPIIYDSGDYPAVLAEALRLLDWVGFDDRRRTALEAGRRLGHGLSMFVEKSGLGPWEEATLRVEADGSLVLAIGLADLGQGMEAAVAQLAADGLGVEPARIHVVHGDTDQVPHGHGSFASRGTATGGVAAYQSGQALRSLLLRQAAHWLEAAPQDLTLGSDGVGVRGVPTRALDFRELAARAHDAGVALSARERFSPPGMVYPYGVHAVELEVDPETGAVRIHRYGVVYDVGRAVNPALVAAQIRGGVAQGLGGARWEELAYDAGGQLITQSFMDYVLPGASEVPDIEVRVLELAPSPLNPLGVKGAGEAGVVGVAPALANALADALSAPAEAFNRLPIRDEDVFWWARGSRQVEGRGRP